MPVNPPAPPLPNDKEKRLERLPTFRFSILTLLKVTTALALLCGFGTILPSSFSQVAIGALWIVASGWLVTGVIFGKGEARAFCIGAAIVGASMWSGLGGRFAEGIQSYLRAIPLHWGSSSSQSLELWLFHIVLAAAAVGNGYLCILAKRFFERQS